MKNYLYHPPLLDKHRVGFKHGTKYPAGFGALTGRPHLGVDYIIEEGKPIYALANGVAHTTRGQHAGNMVILVTDNKLRIRYMHLSKYSSHSKGRVFRGQVIGYTGNTGTSTAPHLHMDIAPNGTPITNFSAFIDPLTLSYATNMPNEKPPKVQFTGDQYITRICENYEILQRYPNIFLSHKYKFVEGAFTWNADEGYRDFVKWWAEHRTKEQFMQAIEADYQTWKVKQNL